MEIWRKHIVEELDAYMGLVFERVAQQAYVRDATTLELPIVREVGPMGGIGSRSPADRDRHRCPSDGWRNGDRSSEVECEACEHGSSRQTSRHVDALEPVGATRGRVRHWRQAQCFFMSLPTDLRRGSCRTPKLLAFRVIAWNLEDLYPSGKDQ